MNGIYNFEHYRTPYLDTEMLMERKMQKQKRRILILSGIATILMAIMALGLLGVIATIDNTLFVISCVLFGGYIIIGSLLIGLKVKTFLPEFKI